MPIVKYRAVHPDMFPRRTRVTVPGWAGADEPRADGSHEQPWHCIPFTEAARAGLELCYPYPDELRVSCRDGAFRFDGGDPADMPPFRSFGADYYTYQLLVDLKVEACWGLKIETHPRFYTDTTGTVPIAVPAILRHWWPMIFFVVFKAPARDSVHIFRPSEPFLQVSLVPIDEKIDLAPMDEDEAAERELQSRRIYASRATLGADTQWISATNTVFDGTYRRIFGAAKSRKTT